MTSGPRPQPKAKSDILHKSKTTKAKIRPPVGMQDFHLAKFLSSLSFSSVQMKALCLLNF